MKKKKINIKIKPRKFTLYSKRKSKSKQVMAGVITVLAAAVLGVVGYGIGKPIVNYFQTKQAQPPQSDAPAWAPTLEDTAEAEITTPSAVETAEPTEEAAAPEQQKQKNAVILPDSAALSSESLNGAIAAAKSNGADSVVVTMKDNVGHLMYKTGLAGVADSDIVTGALTAKQICDIITKAGMTPCAKISTTKDHLGGVYVDGNFIISGESSLWHDAAVANGGKKWLNPFNENTVSYIRSITDELCAAGFKQIVLSDTVFPDFHPSDYSTYLYDQPISDSAARSAALWKVITAADEAAESHGAAVLVEMSANALYSDNRLATNAEAANDAAKLTEVTLLLDYSPESVSYGEARSFIGRNMANYNGVNYSVLLKNSSFSSGASDEVKRAFAEAGIAVFTG